MLRRTVMHERIANAVHGAEGISFVENGEWIRLDLSVYAKSRTIEKDRTLTTS